MKHILTIAILLLGWCIPSFSQITEKIPKKESLFQAPIQPIDKMDNAAKFQSKMDSLNKSSNMNVEIPNAYKGKGDNLIKGLEQKDDTVIREKYLNGKESVIMPGTEKLDSNNLNLQVDTANNIKLIQPKKSNQSKNK